MLKKIQIGYLLPFLFLQIAQGGLRAQQMGHFRYESFLLKDTLLLEDSPFGFNALNITNFGTETQTFSCSVYLPQGWSLLREIPSSINLGSGENTIIPFRLKINTNTIGGYKYAVRVVIREQFSGTEKTHYFTVKTQSTGKWRAQLGQSTLFADDNERLPDFSFLVKNQGTRVEVFNISFDTNLNLTVPRSGFQVLLKPGRDSLVTVGVRSRTLDQVHEKIKIFIQSRNQTQILYQEIYFISDTYIKHNSPFNRGSFTAMYQLNNMLLPSEQQHTMELDGYIPLNRGRGLSLQYRNFVWSNRFFSNNQLFKITLNTKGTNLSLGTYQGLFYENVQGDGLHLQKNWDKGHNESFVIKSRLDNGYAAGSKHTQKLRENIHLESRIYFRENAYSKIRSGAWEEELTFLSKNQKNNHLNLSGGYSMQRVGNMNTTFSGYHVGYDFFYQSKWLSFSSRIKNYSPGYIGIFNGSLMQSHFLRLNFTKFFVSGFGSYSSRNAIQFLNNFTEATPIFANSNLAYGFQSGVHLGKNDIFIQAQNQSQVQFESTSPVANSSSVSINHTFRGEQISHIISIGSSLSTFQEINNNLPVQSYQASINTRYKRFGIVGRWDYGPILYPDFIYFSRTGIFPERRNFSTYFLTKDNKTVRQRLSLNYFQLYTSRQSNFIYRHDFMVYLPKNGLSFNLFGAVNLNQVMATPFLGISLSKTFHTKIPFVKKYKNLTIHLYKDLNLNKKRDLNEPSLPAARIKVGDNYFKTGENGNVKLKNMDKGSYPIYLGNVNGLNGWVSAKGIKDTLHLKKDKEVEIPFIEASTIIGKIETMRADYSLLSNPGLNGILLTAVNEKGEKFQTITNRSGDFYFNVTPGVYTITVPHGLYGSNFEFTQHTFTADLSQAKQQTLNLVLRENTRKLKIKKLD